MDIHGHEYFEAKDGRSAESERCEGCGMSRSHPVTAVAPVQLHLLADDCRRPEEALRESSLSTTLFGARNASLSPCTNGKAKIVRKSGSDKERQHLRRVALRRSRKKSSLPEPEQRTSVARATASSSGKSTRRYFAAGAAVIGTGIGHDRSSVRRSDLRWETLARSLEIVLTNAYARMKQASPSPGQHVDQRRHPMTADIANGGEEVVGEHRGPTGRLATGYRPEKSFGFRRARAQRALTSRPVRQLTSWPPSSWPLFIAQHSRRFHSRRTNRLYRHCEPGDDDGQQETRRKRLPGQPDAVGENTEVAVHGHESERPRDEVRDEHRLREIPEQQGHDASHAAPSVLRTPIS